ncbi:MAG: hypothetical protein AB7L91_06375 [Dehalococcoidia bacterium]
MSGKQPAVPDCPHGVSNAASSEAWDAEYAIEQQTGQRQPSRVCSCCLGPCGPSEWRCRTCQVEVQTDG